MRTNTCEEGDKERGSRTYNREVTRKREGVRGREYTYRKKEYVSPRAGPRTGMTTPTQARSGKNLTEM